MKTHIMYHHPCMDGTTAAAVAYLKFGDEANYIPANYGKEIDLDQIKLDDILYILDFSLSLEETSILLDRGVHIIALDHHISAFQKLDSIKDRFKECIFDKERSGAGITWDYFFPNKPRSTFVSLVEDRDLWKFKYAESKPLYCYMGTLDYNYKVVSKLIQDYEDEVHRDVILGLAKGAYALYDKIAEDFSNKPVGKIKLAGKEITMFNVHPRFGSEVCSKYVERNPTEYAGYYYVNKINKNEAIYGLGLRCKGDLTVNDIAETMGGGGHAQAAGMGYIGNILDLEWI